MRGRAHISLLLLWLLLFAGAPEGQAIARRPQHRMMVEQIQKLEGEWREAQLSDDVATMDRLLSDDFLGITAAGQVVTKAQQLDRMRTREVMLKELSLEDRKIKLVGSVAIVTSLAHIDGTAEGRPLKGSFRYTRVYQRIGSVWKITSFEATRIPGGGSVYAAAHS